MQSIAGVMMEGEPEGCTDSTDRNRADHETGKTGGDDRAVSCSSPGTPRREPGGWRKRHWLCLPRATRKEGHQEIPRRFDMHQFMSTYKIQKCACRHFLFSAQVYVEIFFTCRHVFFSCQHIYFELSIVNILDEPFDMHFIHSTCSLYL